MWTLFLSIRYFLARKKHGFISFINFTSIFGIAIGVAALIIVISVMNGFDNEIQSKIIGTYSHIMIFKSDGVENKEKLLKMLDALPYVEHAAPFVTGQAVLESKKDISGVLIKGVEPGREALVTNIMSYTAGNVKNIPGGEIILGEELMHNARINIGDTVEVMVPYSIMDIKKKKFTVTGYFNSGRYDYDSNIVLINIADAAELYKLGDRVSGLALKLTPKANVLDIKDRMSNIFKPPYSVKSWMDLDRNLLSALAMEKKMMFLILGVIIIVACFNICSSLIMMVMEKTRDIGILKAIGANFIGISAVFVMEGFFTGALGAGIGCFIGINVANNVNSISDLIKRFTGCELFPKDVYYFDKIPVDVNAHDVWVIIALALLFSLVSGLFPAWKASRLDPVEAIRYE
ncbi:MAG: lipoprotein-releasing ABC transporter permease subunit [Candidatus Omnitrophica bacterium]|nr:lipoprotein-releasing ABC transporter permease subunit [Candidatus Omnitrophota bacterium]